MFNGLIKIQMIVMIKKYLCQFACACWVLGLLVGCQEEAYVPKPKGFHRLELPPHEYVQLPDEYPYTFELSKHAVVVPDSSFMTEPYWIEIKYPAFEATLSVAYKPIRNNLDSLIELSNDSHRLTNKHYVKASAIDEYQAYTPKGYTALVFELEGDIPSPFQYYVTDSSQHFLRVALYFPYANKNDSIKPIIDYVKYDMARMMNSTDWRKNK